MTTKASVNMQNYWFEIIICFSACCKCVLCYTWQSNLFSALRKLLPRNMLWSADFCVIERLIGHFKMSSNSCNSLCIQRILLCTHWQQLIFDIAQLSELRFFKSSMSSTLWGTSWYLPVSAIRALHFIQFVWKERLFAERGTLCQQCTTISFSKYANWAVLVLNIHWNLSIHALMVTPTLSRTVEL